jgi:hypothetical protein
MHSDVGTSRMELEADDFDDTDSNAQQQEMLDEQMKLKPWYSFLLQLRRHPYSLEFVYLSRVVSESNQSSHSEPVFV